VKAVCRVEGNQMKKHFVLIQTFLATTALANVMDLNAQETITIPAGTAISARLASQLDSGEVHAGDLVTMDVLEDVRIKGELVIPHGALVMGHITEAKGARKMGRGGKLNVKFETVTAGDSTKVPVSGDQAAKGKGGYGGGSLVGAGAAGFFFPPAAALLLLKHGHASVIPVGTVIAVHVTEDTPVLATQVVLVPTAVVATRVAPPRSAQLESTTASEVRVESVADASRRLRAEKAAAKAKSQP
jgi:hypothetical protein